MKRTLYGVTSVAAVIVLVVTGFVVFRGGEDNGQQKKPPPGQRQEINKYLDEVAPKLAGHLLVEANPYLTDEERKTAVAMMKNMKSFEDQEKYIFYLEGVFGEGILRKATAKHPGDSPEAAIERIKIEAKHKKILKALRTYNDILSIRDGKAIGPNLLPDLKKELSEILKEMWEK